jgi:selenocysteine lyase/cysteine desulfurase
MDRGRAWVSLAHHNTVGEVRRFGEAMKAASRKL